MNYAKRTVADVGKSKYVCRCCGHPILPTDPLAFLFPTERAIFNTIYRAGQAGISRAAVWERVYANTREGLNTDAADPLSVVSAHISNANKKLRWIGMEISSSHGTGKGSGKSATYRVRRLPQDPAQREGQNGA